MRQAGIEAPGEVEEEVAGVVEGLTARPAATPSAAEVQVETVDEVPPIGDTMHVLVAEIPKGSTRWEQANFSKETFISFFGASETIQRRAYFFHVRSDGTMGQQEVRPAVAVQSHNYRFELGAAKGLAYPIAGRPIGLFVRIAARTFLYMLLLPGSPGHPEISLLLDGQAASGSHMRRFEFDAATVRAAWPGAPLWQRLTV
jgi:hypothetical protein